MVLSSAEMGRWWPQPAVKGLPGWFWGEVVNTTVYILNRCPTKSVKGMTPFEAWHGNKLAVHHLKIFGCIVYVWNMKPHL